MSYQKYSLYLIATAVLAGVMFYSFFSSTHETLLKTTPAPVATTTVSTATSATATLSVEGKTYRAPIQTGETVLELMRNLAPQGFTFTGREYPSLGFFIDSINGKKSSGGMYWFLYVNSTSSKTGASQTKLHAGDSIEWRFKNSE